MIQFIYRIFPAPVLRFLIRLKYKLEAIVNSFRPAQKVFQSIYKNQNWGKKNDGFFSGPGSDVETSTKPYVDLINDFLAKHRDLRVIVDLGCGDFNVAKGFVDNCKKYIGIDIVPELIEYLRSKYKRENVEFRCLDIIREELPKGDLCLIRQVFQHLSNDEILSVLPKLRQYKIVFITEHYPNDKQVIQPNKDIVHGRYTRAYYNSAVYLNAPPFNIPTDNLELVLEVPGTGLNSLFDSGVIRTYKLTHSLPDERN